MELRNASVKLPADLHQQIKDELEAKNITMSQFFEMAAKEHFDKEKGGTTMANGRTLAFTVSCSGPSAQSRTGSASIASIRGRM